jgi:hypothetical protein
MSIILTMAENDWLGQRLLIEGQMNPIQLELVRSAAARMAAGSEIVAALDADTEGRKLADVVRQAVELAARTDQEPSGFSMLSPGKRRGRGIHLDV